ncbi:YybH family protein [Sphingopyxis sp. 550A]
MSLAEDRDLLAHLAVQWSEAAADWNPAELAALYAEDALLFGGREGHAVGRAAIAEYFESYRGVIVSATLKLVEQELLAVDTSCFFAQGSAEFSFMLAGGHQTRSQLRTSLLVLRGAGGRIRAHHFSPVPETPPLGD